MADSSKVRFGAFSFLLSSGAGTALKYALRTLPFGTANQQRGKRK